MDNVSTELFKCLIKTTDNLQIKLHPVTLYESRFNSLTCEILPPVSYLLSNHPLDVDVNIMRPLRNTFLKMKPNQSGGSRSPCMVEHYHQLIKVILNYSVTVCNIFHQRSDGLRSHGDC